MSEDEVGSVADEAAKLLDALQGWAREGGGGAGREDGAASEGNRWADRLADLNAHLGTGEDCTYCPVCRAVGVVRQASPEVRVHLATAASSLLQAAAGLLDAHAQSGARRSSGVEKIDLDEAEGPGDGSDGDGAGWDGPEWGGSEWGGSEWDAD